jgi:hypothetical protein
MYDHRCRTSRHGHRYGLRLGFYAATRAETLDTLVARQAAAYVARPGFAAHAESVLARFGAAHLPAVEAGRAFFGFKALARDPLSAYVCSPTSSPRRSSAVYRCMINGTPIGMATATCDVSTGRCRHWHVGVLVFTFTGTTGPGRIR